MRSDRIFSGSGVTLLPVDPDRDAAGLYELFLDERMHRYTGNCVPNDVAEIRKLLQSYGDHPGIWAWAVYDGETLVGTYWMAMPVEADGRRIIPADAQRIGVPYWRKGYARRCRDLLYRFAFEELQVDAIHAQAWAENENSCTAMSRYGFILERQVEDFNPRHQRNMLANSYVLTREAFEAKRAPCQTGR